MSQCLRKVSGPRGEMMGTSEILIGSLALALTYTQFARGQTVDEKRLTFDAASVKPSPVVDSSYASGDKGVAIARKQPGRARRGGPETGAPGRVYIPETSLKTLLVEAFDVGYFQVLGPDWLNQERFDMKLSCHRRLPRYSFTQCCRT